MKIYFFENKKTKKTQLFINLLLETLDKRKLYQIPCKFYETVLHPLEILGTKMKTNIYIQYCIEIQYDIFLNIHKIPCPPYICYIWALLKLCKLSNIYAPKAGTSVWGFTFNNFFSYYMHIYIFIIYIIYIICLYIYYIYIYIYLPLILLIVNFLLTRDGF